MTAPVPSLTSPRRRRRPVTLRILPAIIVALLAAAGLLPAGMAQAAEPAPITPGTPFHVVLADFAQVATYSFTGTAGQNVTVAHDHSVGVSTTQYRLSNDTQSLDGVFVDQFGEIGTLPESGTWTLTVTNWSFLPLDVQATLTLITETTAPLTFGTSITQALTTPGLTQNLTFTGTAGQKIAVALTATDLHSTGPASVDVSVRRPDGTPPAGFDTQSLNGPGLLSGTLDASGTWSVRIDPAGDTTGSVTFTATRPVDQTLTATVNKSLTLTFPGGGRDVRLLLPVTAGQRITLQGVTSSLTAQYGQNAAPAVSAKVISPDGRFSSTIRDSVIVGYQELYDPLPSSGTWTVLMHPVADTIGTQTVRLGLVTDIKATVTQGTAIPVSVRAPGQNAVYTFTARAGQGLIVTLDNQSWTGGSRGGALGDVGANAWLVDPSGQTLLSVNTGTSFAEVKELPVDGAYTITVDPVSDSIGSATLTVRAPKVTTAKLAYDKPVTAAFDRGDVLRYTFTGSAGQHGTIQVTATNWTSPGTNSAATFALRRPDGSVAWRSTSIYQPGFIEPPALDVKGAWALEVDPDGASTGSVTFSARAVADQKASLTYGKQVTTKISIAGQAARYTFTAKAGDRVAVDTVKQSWTSPATGGPTSDAVVQLIGPDGTVTNLGTGVPYPNPDSVTTWAQADYAIQVSGTWTLLIDPYTDYVGSKTFALRKLETIKSGTITMGTAKQVPIPSKGAWNESSLTHVTGGVGFVYYDWSVTGSTIPQGVFSIIRADGVTVATDYFGPGSATGTLEVISQAAGPMTFRVQAGAGQTGTATVTLTRRIM